MRRATAAFTALFAAAVVGCTDTVVQPKSTVTSANIFADPNSYTQFIAKVYAGLALTGQQGPTNNSDIQQFDEGFSEYIRVWWQLNELPTDEAVVAWGDPGLPEINTGQWVSSNVWVTAMYARVFFQVAMANEFLRQTTDAQLDARGVTPAWKAIVHTYRAEARFLRAYSYWHGMDMFGSIPLVTENDPIGAIAPKPVPRDSIYRYIVSELTAISADLPPDHAPTSYGRATPAAAQMLLAHVYLNAGVYTGTPDYTHALAAASAAIAAGYSLAPNYRNNFLADNNTSPEIIWAVPFDGTHTQTWGGTTFLVHAGCGGSNLPAGFSNGTNGCWWGIRLKPEAYNRYLAEPAGDSRMSYFYNTANPTVTSISTFDDGVAAPKYLNLTSTGATGSDQTFPDTDYPVFRLADAYLIYIECYLRGGGGTGAQALAYFNAIRERAYGNTNGDIASLTAGSAADLQLVLDERSRELLWEGFRRMDLIRYGLFSGGTYNWSWKNGVMTGAAYPAHLDLFPIPLNELSANPNMVQNQGY